MFVCFVCGLSCGVIRCVDVSFCVCVCCDLLCDVVRLGFFVLIYVCVAFKIIRLCGGCVLYCAMLYGSFFCVHVLSLCLFVCVLGF